MGQGQGVVARPGNTRLAKLDTETKALDRNDLGNVDIWHPSESLTPGCNGVGGWGGLQLSTSSQAVQVRNNIERRRKRLKNVNPHSFMHAISLSSGSKLPTLLCSGLSLPIASASLKSFLAPLGPPLPRELAKLEHPYVKPYFQG